MHDLARREARALGLCALGAEQAMTGRVCPAPELLRAVQAAGVLPALAASRVRVSLPVAAQQQLAAVAMATGARNRAGLADLRTATAALQRVGIPSVPLKGAALLLAGVHAPEHRHTDDVDLLVPRDRTRAAYDALRAARFGGRLTPTHDARDAADAPTHEMPALRGPHGALVELHVATHIPRAPADDFAHAWRDADEVDLEGIVIRVPSVRVLLEQTSFHVVDHHAMLPRYWARHLFDVAALLRVLGAAGAPVPGAGLSTADAVGLSIAVLAGARSAHASFAERALATLLVLPPPSIEACWEGRALGLRSLRFAEGGLAALLSAVMPSTEHLRFTGDLAAGRTLGAAHLRRWRRIASRASGGLAR